MFIGFGPEAKLIELDRLLPAALRGMTYDAVKASDKIGQFFDLADLVLISHDAFNRHIQSLEMHGASAEHPVKTKLPSADLDVLRARDEDGNLLPKTMTALFAIVAAYWDNPGKLAIEPGLVAALWRRGMAGADIIRCIQASTGKDGKLIKASGRGHDIMTTVIDAYLESQGLPPDAEVSQVDMKALIDRWLTATRSADLGSKDMQNSLIHWSEYRRLGLIDEAGTAQTDQVRLIAEKIFKFDTPLSFKQISAWIDQYHPPQTANARLTPKVARALLKKNRKKGKLNRKRGRR